MRGPEARSEHPTLVPGQPQLLWSRDKDRAQGCGGGGAPGWVGGEEGCVDVGRKAALKRTILVTSPSRPHPKPHTCKCVGNSLCSATRLKIILDPGCDLNSMAPLLMKSPIPYLSPGGSLSKHHHLGVRPPTYELGGGTGTPFSLQRYPTT